MKKIVVIIFILMQIIHLYCDESADIYDDYYFLEDVADGIDIFASKPLSQDLITINRETIESYNSQNAAEIISSAANLSLYTYGGYGNLATINIRGSSGTRVLILKNGVPLNSGLSGDFDLSSIPVADIEEIQVIKGGSDTLFNYSGAIGGIINIITKSKKRDSFSLSSTIFNLFYYPDFYYNNSGYKYFSPWYDFFDTQNLNINFSLTKGMVTFQLYGEGNRAGNSFIYIDEDGYKRRRDGNLIWDAKSTAGLSLRFPYRINLDINGSFGYSYKNIPGTITNTVQGVQTDWRGGCSIIFESEYTGIEQLSTSFIVDYRYHRLTWDQGSIHSIHNLHTIFTTDRWEINPIDWFTLSIGGDFTCDIADSTDLGVLYNFNGGGYINAEFNIRDKVIITQSNKLVSGNNFPIFIPKVGILVNIDEYFQYRHNIYRTYRNPALNDLYWPADSYAKGNPDLKPEDGFGTDMVIGYQRPGIVKASSSLYFNYLWNSISWSPSGGLWRPENLGELIVIGSEHSVESDFSHYLKLFASYNFCYTLVSSGENNPAGTVHFRDDKRAVYKPLHTLSFGANISWGSGSLNITGHFESERYTTILNVTKLDPVFTMDIDFRQKVGIITLFASFKNIFNNFSMSMEGYPAPNGSFVTGIKVDFEQKI